MWWIYVVLMMLWALPAHAGGIRVNNKGTVGASVSVTNAVKTVLDGLQGRPSYTIAPETNDIRCVFGPPDGSAPSPAPSTTVGYLIKAATTLSVIASDQNRQTTWGRIDCFSTGAATNVNTAEEIP